jgi:putative DNA primase/helicase
MNDIKEDAIAGQQSHRRFDPNSFPHPPSIPGRAPPATIENVEHLLDQGGFGCRFNIIKKRTELRHADGTTASMSQVVSFAIRHGFSTGWLYQFVDEVAAKRSYNPVGEWILSQPWDHKDRLPELYDTIIEGDDYPAGLKEALMERWMLSVAQAALAKGPFRARGVLTLQGAQGIGKTSWIGALLPAGKLRNDCILLDHHLDGSNKDSIINAVTHHIVEIGELDSSFRKDVARLKGFLTNDCDKLRRPYARDVVEYPRRTVFAATVNDDRFLVDATGNSRWWTIAAKLIRYEHGIDMQQLYAQLAEQLKAGEQWWLTPKEERQLAEYNMRHRAVSAVAERVLEYINPEAHDGAYMTAIEVLRAINIANPTTSQCKECAAVLRESYGPSKRVQGRDRWRVTKRHLDRDEIF